MRHAITAGCLLALLLPTAVAHAATDGGHDIWMSVHVQGRKIGSSHLTRVIDDNTVTSTQTLRLAIDRGGTTMTIETREADTETRHGKVLGFDLRLHVSGSDNHVHGERLADGRMRVTRSVAGQSHASVIDWTDGALLAQGQRLAQRRAGFAPDTRFSMKAYDAASGRVIEVKRHVIGAETVALPAGRETLTRVESDLHSSGVPRHMTLWFDADGSVRKMRMTMLGQPLELLACDRACAQAPNQPSNLFAHTLTPLPHALSTTQRSGELHYWVRSSDAKPLHFARTDAQQVEKTDAGWRIDIGDPSAQREAPPTARDTAATVWLQSDNPELRALARKAAGKASGSAARMQALQGFVATYITHKNLGVGYASALETLHSRSGDCTEHAVLLAALGRALGIPTRVVTGLVYMPHYLGRAHVLVPHAWVQSFVDGRWRGYDAALGGFDSGHIALSVGNGDPWRFYAGVPTLGRLKVASVRSQAARDPEADAAAAR